MPLFAATYQPPFTVGPDRSEWPEGFWRERPEVPKLRETICHYSNPEQALNAAGFFIPLNSEETIRVCTLLKIEEDSLSREASPRQIYSSANDELPFVIHQEIRNSILSPLYPEGVTRRTELRNRLAVERIWKEDGIRYVGGNLAEFISRHESWVALRIQNRGPACFGEFLRNQGWQGEFEKIGENFAAPLSQSENEAELESNRPWTQEEDRKALQMRDKSKSYEQIARELGRTRPSVYSRLRKLAPKKKKM